MQPVPMGRDDPGSDWFFEPLFDGHRCLAVHDGESLTLRRSDSRPVFARFPALEEAITAAGPPRFAIDGEILAVDPSFEQGLVLSSAERVVGDGRDHQHEYRFLAFDLIWAGGDDLRSIPLRERRNVMRALFQFSPTVMYVRESSAPGEMVFAQAEQERWPGVVAKHAGSRYVSGPSADWRAWRRPSS
jgi:bifunctional non-homologous end joining protein LigD